MEVRKLQQTTYVESNPPVTHPLAILWSFIGGLLLLIFMIVGIIAAHDAFVIGASVMIKLLVGLLVILIPGALIIGIVVWYQEHTRKVLAEQRNQELEEEHKEVKIDRIRD